MAYSRPTYFWHLDGYLASYTTYFTHDKYRPTTLFYHSPGASLVGLRL